MKQFLNISVILFFMGIILFPIASEFVELVPDIESTENRALNPFPEMSKENIDSIPQQFDDFYTDHFEARNHLLKLNSQIKFHWFSIPPFDGKAFIGRFGWMYPLNEEMDLYLGNNLLSQDTLERFMEVVEYRKQQLAKIGCKYYLVIVPVKSSIYPEYIPFSKQKEVDTTLTDQVVDMLHKDLGIEVIDLRQTFIESKEEGRLYQKTDNHWNEFGGYVAYREIMRRLSEDFPGTEPLDISSFKIDEVETKGKNLTNMLGIFDGVEEIEIRFTPEFDKNATTGEKQNYPVPGWFPYKKRYEQVFVIPDTSKPKLLAIHDSFGFTLIPFLNEHFSKSVFIFDAWQHALNKPIVENEQPDIFLQIVSESLLPNIPKNAKKP